MKKINELPAEEIFKIVLNNEELNNKFGEYIIDSEYAWLDEKMLCFNRNCIDYSYGIFSNNYITIDDEYYFIQGIENVINTFGATPKLENLFRQTQRLFDSNLFSYYCKKLSDLFLEEEIKIPINYLEDILKDLDSHVITDKFKNNLMEFLDCFISNGYLDNYYIDDNNKLFIMNYLKNYKYKN